MLKLPLCFPYSAFDRAFHCIIVCSLCRLIEPIAIKDVHRPFGIQPGEKRCQLGLPGRYAILIDLAVLAALLWSMIVTYQIWRKRRDMRG